MNRMGRYYNEDCIEGCQKHIRDDSIDLIITDPPYGINGDTLHGHYNRHEDFVIDGYVEIPQDEYYDFSIKWVQQAERILRPGGSVYVVSGYSNLIDLLNALKQTSLEEVNHLIWKYNFGVYTSKKYVSSHFHILYYIKPGPNVTFNTYCRYGNNEKTPDGKGSHNYRDREDVWIINKEYKPGQRKNKNELPKALLTKIIQYSSNEGDTVCDLFLGSFSTAKVAIGLNRKAVGFEISQNAFEYQSKEINKIKPGQDLIHLRKPIEEPYPNQGKPLNDQEIYEIQTRFEELMPIYKTKKKTIEILTQEFGRGRFSIHNIINRNRNLSSKTDESMD